MGFSVTMDTADFNSESSMYEFVKNGEAIAGTRIYSDAGLPHPRKGRSAIYDTTPASNTIFLKLEEYDEVARTRAQLETAELQLKIAQNESKRLKNELEQ